MYNDDLPLPDPQVLARHTLHIHTIMIKLLHNYTYNIIHTCIHIIYTCTYIIYTCTHIIHTCTYIIHTCTCTHSTPMYHELIPV